MWLRKKRCEKFKQFDIVDWNDLPFMVIEVYPSSCDLRGLNGAKYFGVPVSSLKLTEPPKERRTSKWLTTDRHQER